MINTKHLDQKKSDQNVGRSLIKQQRKIVSPVRSSYRILGATKGSELQLSANGESVFRNVRKLDSATTGIVRARVSQEQRVPARRSNFPN